MCMYGFFVDQPLNTFLKHACDYTYMEVFRIYYAPGTTLSLME